MVRVESGELVPCCWCVFASVCAKCCGTETLYLSIAMLWILQLLRQHQAAKAANESFDNARDIHVQRTQYVLCVRPITEY